MSVCMSVLCSTPSSQPVDFRECSLNYEACGVAETTERVFERVRKIMYGCLRLGVTVEEITGKFIEVFIFFLPWEETVRVRGEREGEGHECRVRGRGEESERR